MSFTCAQIFFVTIILGPIKYFLPLAINLNDFQARSAGIVLVDLSISESLKKTGPVRASIPPFLKLFLIILIQFFGTIVSASHLAIISYLAELNPLFRAGVIPWTFSLIIFTPNF